MHLANALQCPCIYLCGLTVSYSNDSNKRTTPFLKSFWWHWQTAG